MVFLIHILFNSSEALEIMITISLKFSSLCSVPFYDYSSNTSAGFLSFVDS